MRVTRRSVCTAAMGESYTTSLLYLCVCVCVYLPIQLKQKVIHPEKRKGKKIILLSIYQ